MTHNHNTTPTDAETDIETKTEHRAMPPTPHVAGTAGDIDRKLSLLSDEWGTVWMTYNTDHPSAPCVIRNRRPSRATPHDMRVARGETFADAIDDAFDQYVVTSYSPGDPDA